VSGEWYRTTSSSSLVRSSVRVAESKPRTRAGRPCESATRKKTERTQNPWKERASDVGNDVEKQRTRQWSKALKSRIGREKTTACRSEIPMVSEGAGFGQCRGESVQVRRTRCEVCGSATSVVLCALRPLEVFEALG